MNQGEAEFIAVLTAERQNTCDLLNERNLSLYAAYSHGWVETAKRARDNHIPIDPPLVAPWKLKVFFREQDGVPEYPYIDDTNERVAPEPILPPVDQLPAPGNVSIGQKLYGKYWQAKNDDTVPDGYVLKADGTHPSLMKIVLPFNLDAQMHVHGGLYIEV